jgi:hypothetical protein
MMFSWQMLYMGWVTRDLLFGIEKYKNIKRLFIHLCQCDLHSVDLMLSAGELAMISESYRFICACCWI